ncbi:MAG: transglycosylase domain-containing protein [Candidatus Shapirobacteria bacterium]|jgi:penicillin-binding protein 1C
MKNKEKRKTKKRSSRAGGWWKLVIGVVVLVIGGGFFLLKDMPNPKKLAEDNFPESSKMYDRNQVLLYEFYSDKRRIPVALNEVPDKIKKATLAIEDANFYYHFGFDIKGILRGLYRTVVERRLQGGSTITQQLVKNALLTQERTVSRKIKEAILTVVTELMYSKDQILEMYLNQTPYGGTMYGIEAAAQGIFNKSCKDLTLAETALITGLPGSPSKYSPFGHPEAAKNRQKMVLARMRELGMISEEEKLAAEEEKLNYYLNKSGILAPHFVFYTKEILIDKYGLQKLNEGGLKIKTTLDWQIQELAEKTVASETAKLEKYKVSNGAVLVTQPKSGQILAMVGSKDYFSNEIEGNYNVVTANRQPGSSIKPINYAIGLELGKVTPSSIFYDNPTCFKGIKLYCPTNYGNRYYGVQTLRNSLGNSLNIAAVKMLKLNTVETFIASASAMGISSFKDPKDYGLSLTLGGGEVTMLEMTKAFGTLANMGVVQDLTPILEVRDKKNEILEEYKNIPGDRVLSRETAYLIQNILSDDGARGMVFGRGSMLNIKDHPEVAVKTGTTNDMRDNWTIGYNSEVVATVWVGNNDNSRMGGLVSGTTGAAPIWNKIMTEILKGKPVKKPTMPQNIVGMYVCNNTGQLVPDEGCDSHYEYFNKKFVPDRKAALKRSVLIDKDTSQIVTEGEEKPNVKWQEHMVVTDVTGETVCLDCIAVSEEKKVTVINQ